MTRTSRAAWVLAIAPLMMGCPEEPLPGLSTASSADGTDGSSTDTSSTESETGDEPGSNMIEIPGATFAMGCGADDAACDPDNPEHQVTVSTFMIERTEVSVTEYRACVTDGMCTAPAMDPDCNYGVDGRDPHPVNCVTWQQAVDYCSYRGRRLPTEAEWELAAAGPDARTFPWGSADATCAFAHMFQSNGNMGGYGCLTNITSPVDNYQDGASINGVLQLAGNVEEWGRRLVRRGLLHDRRDDGSTGADPTARPRSSAAATGSTRAR